MTSTQIKLELFIHQKLLKSIYQLAQHIKNHLKTYIHIGCLPVTDPIRSQFITRRSRMNI